jgi:hypothetical protein
MTDRFEHDGKLIRRPQPVPVGHGKRGARRLLEESRALTVQTDFGDT